MGKSKNTMVEGENSKQTTRTAAGTCRVPALPEGWITRVSRHYPDRVYYYNTATGASTWNMPDLDQSSSASGKKRKRHRHHHRKKGDVKQSDDRNQSTQHQQRLSTDDPDIDDEDCLDLMYESGGEPDSVSCTLAVDASEVKDRAPHASTADVSEVNCKKSRKETPDKKQKKKWKQLWDSSSGLKANSSSLEEERGLTAEELQIIRFPECKGSHGIKAIDATSQVSDRRNLAEVTKAASSSHCGILQGHTDANMDNCTRFSNILPKSNRSEKIAGKKQTNAASSESVIEWRQSVKGSSVMVTSMKQGKTSMSQPHAKASDNRVLTTVKPANTCGNSVSGNASWSGKDGSSVIPDTSKATSGRNTGAPKIYEKTVSHTKNLAKKPKTTQNQKFPQTPETSRGMANVHKTTPPSGSCLPSASSPVIRGEENLANLDPELSRTQVGDGGGERTFLKAKRRMKTSPSVDQTCQQQTSPTVTPVCIPSSDNSQGNAPHTPVFTPVPSKGSTKLPSASTFVSSGVKDSKPAKPSAPRLSGSVQPTQIPSRDPVSPALTVVHKPSQGVDQPSPCSQQVLSHHTSDSSLTNLPRTCQSSCVVTSASAVARPQLQTAAQSRSETSVPAVTLRTVSPHIISETPVQRTVSQHVYSETPVQRTVSPHVYSETPAQRTVSLHTNGETPAQTATSTLPAPSLPQQTSVSETSTPAVNLTSPAPDQVDKKKRRQRRRKKSTPDLEMPLGNATSGILTPTVSPSDEKAPPLPNAFPITPDTPGKGRGLAGGGGACWGGREGEAAMEVDDAFYYDCQDSDEDQIMMDLQEFREKFRPEMKSEAVGVLTESVQKTQASRPTSPGPQPASARKMIYIVVDTNVLFGALGFLQVLRDMALKGYGHPFLVFPWVVLQELDGLKNSKTKSKTAQNAVRYIHSCLLSHHPRVRGQTPAQALESAESFPAQCNDDRVLQCCVQCQKKYGADFVLLLTDDLNLENKAVVMGITTFSSKRLQPLMDKPIHENEYPAPKNDPPAVGVPTGGVHTPEVPQQRRVAPGRSTPVSTPMTASRGRQTPQGRGTISPVVETNQQLYQHRAMMEGLWKEAKCVVKTALSGVVQAEMKEAFGDLWLDVVIRKPPWSPLELVMVLQKHWIAVFGLKFDRGMKTVVDDLVKEFRQTRGGSRGLSSLTMCLQKCLLLVTSVNFVRPCQEYVQQLKEVVRKGKALLQESSKTTTPPSPSTFPKPGFLQTPRTMEPNSTLSSVTHWDSQVLKIATPFTLSSSSSSQFPSETITSSSIPLNHSEKPFGVVEDGNMNQLRSAAAASDGKSLSVQIPQANSAEESAAIEGVFQSIWGAINNCCDNVEKMLGPSSENNDLHSVKDTVCRLLPHVVQLLSVFQKCLLFSPSELEPEMDIFCSLCFCLNTFFEHADIPATPLPLINPGNMIIFVRQTETRTLLQIGLEQLNVLTERLQKIISCISSVL